MIKFKTMCVQIQEILNSCVHIFKGFVNLSVQDSDHLFGARIREILRSICIHIMIKI